MDQRPFLLFFSTIDRVDLFDSKFLRMSFRDGILVNDDVHRFVPHERFGSIEVSTEFVILIPRVFHDVVNRTVFWSFALPITCIPWSSVVKSSCQTLVVSFLE